VDGTLVDARPYFPGIMVGKIYLYFPVSLFGGVGYQSLHNTEYDYS
jgi:hypothetical protein